MSPTNSAGKGRMMAKAMQKKFLSLTAASSIEFGSAFTTSMERADLDLFKLQDLVNKEFEKQSKSGKIELLNQLAENQETESEEETAANAMQSFGQNKKIGSEAHDDGIDEEDKQEGAKPEKDAEQNENPDSAEEETPEESSPEESPPTPQEEMAQKDAAHDNEKKAEHQRLRDQETSAQDNEDNQDQEDEENNDSDGNDENDQEAQKEQEEAQKKQQEMGQQQQAEIRKRGIITRAINRLARYKKQIDALNAKIQSLEKRKKEFKKGSKW